MVRWCCFLTLLAPLAAEPLLSENFDAVADGELPAGWRVEGGRWAVRGGQLRAEPAGYVSKVVLPLGELASAAVEVTVRFEQVKDNARWLALMVRQPQGQPTPFLIFTHRFDRTRPNGLEFGFLNSAKPVQWRIYRAAGVPVAPVLGEPHRLRCEVRGRRVRGLLDGRLVLTAYLPSEVPPRGEVGLIVSDVTAVFDDLVVESLPPPDAAEEAWLHGRPRPLIIGHRGDSAHAPENTVAAIRQAFDAGADAVEVDVAQTADGHLVLLHDATVDRTTDGTGKLADLTLDRVRALDAGSWKDARYAGERVPTFGEALQAATERGLLLLDLKAEGLLESIAAEVRAKEMTDRVLLCCWSARQAADARQHLPEAPACQLGSAPLEPPADWFRAILAKGLRGLSMNYQSLTPEFVREAHLRAMPVYAWTINDPGSIELVSAMGVDGILTDDVPMALAAAAPRP